MLVTMICACLQAKYWVVMFRVIDEGMDVDDSCHVYRNDSNIQSFVTLINSTHSQPISLHIELVVRDIR